MPWGVDNSYTVIPSQGKEKEQSVVNLCVWVGTVSIYDTANMNFCSYLPKSELKFEWAKINKKYIF